MEFGSFIVAVNPSMLELKLMINYGRHFDV